MKNFVITLLAIALILSACSQPAAVPVAQVSAGEQALRELLVVCSDQKCGPNIFLQPNVLAAEELEVIRAVAGPASFDEAAWIRVREYYAARNMRLETIDLIAHIDEEMPGCGGLISCSTIQGGGSVNPPEFNEWVGKNLKTPDAYAGLETSAQAAKRVFPDSQINRYFLVNSTQRLIPVAADGPRSATFLSKAEWANWPRVALPEMSASGIDIPSIRLLMDMNESVRPAAAKIVQELMAHPHGQPFQNLYIATSTDFGFAVQMTDGFVVTHLPGVTSPASVAAQLSYGVKNATMTEYPTVVKIVGESTGDAAALLDGLNASPSFRDLIANPEWQGWVEFRLGRSGMLLNSAIVRYPGMPLTKIYSPITGGSGVSVQMQVPIVMDEAAIAEAFARAGVPAKQSVVRAALTKLAPYVGTTVRIVGYGFIAISVVYVLDAAGNILFAWGPSLQVPTGYYSPVSNDVNPTLYNAIRVPMVDVNGAMEYSIPAIISSAGQGVDLYGAWDQLQDRASRGETPCFGLTLDDRTVANVPLITDIAEADIMTPIVYCLGEEWTLNEPGTIIVANASNGAQVVFRFNTNTAMSDWEYVSGDPADLSWTIPYNAGDGIVCTQHVGFVREDHFRIQSTPQCAQ